jgi:hypothetical protein
LRAAFDRANVRHDAGRLGCRFARLALRQHNLNLLAEFPSLDGGDSGLDRLGQACYRSRQSQSCPRPNPARSGALASANAHCLQRRAYAISASPPNMAFHPALLSLKPAEGSGS